MPPAPLLLQSPALTCHLTMTVLACTTAPLHHCSNRVALPPAPPCPAAAVVSFAMSLGYATVGLLLPSVDEEIHISVTILVSRVAHGDCRRLATLNAVSAQQWHLTACPSSGR